MNSLAHEVRASYAFVERNVNIIKRYWGWEIVWLCYTVANALAVTFIGAGMEQISGVKVDARRVITFLLIGAIVWHYLNVVFNTVAETITWERWEGTIEYTLMAPIYRVTHLIGSTVFSLVYGAVHTVVIALIVTAFFDLDLSGANLPAAALVMVVGSISFIGLGILGAVLPLMYPERGTQMVYVIQAVLLLVSGVYCPIAALPGWLQVLARFSPATYVLEGMRAAIQKGVGIGELMPTMIPLFLLGLLMLPLGVFVFCQAERYAKKTGRLKRHG